MSAVFKDRSNERKGKVPPGWHKAGKNSETARLQRIARADKANARFSGMTIVYVDNHGFIVRYSDGSTEYVQRKRIRKGDCAAMWYPKHA